MNTDERSKICNAVRIIYALAPAGTTANKLTKIVRSLLDISIANDTVSRILNGENP